MAQTHAIAQRAAIDWKAAIWAGLIAGTVFMMLEMVMVWLFLGQSPWGPPRMIAAMVLGRDVLPPPATFDFGILMTAMMVHFALSILYAIILALLIARWNTATAVLAGAVFGLLLYLINFYGFTAVFPWFAMARNWVSIFSHILFGAVIGWAYKALASR
jgi:uncharacterized membrane protein YagU involved in acid resistance